MVWRIFHGFNWYLYLDMITQYKFSCCLYVARIYSVVELVLINCAEYEGKITVKLLGMYCFSTVGVGGRQKLPSPFHLTLVFLVCMAGRQFHLVHYFCCSM